VALLSSIALIFTAILVLQSSSRDDRDRESRGFGGGFGGGGYGYSYWWGPTPFDFFYYNPYAPYGINRYEDPKELSFLESVFSVLFGDGNPNASIEERRSKAVAQLIRARGGAVTAEELAPYMDPDGGPPTEEGLVDEGYVLPAVTRFGGVPEVTEDGDIIYTFDDLQVSAEGTGGKESLMKMPVSEIRKLADKEGVSLAGLFDKEDLVAALSTAMQVKGEREASAPLSPFLREQEYEFSLASTGQKVAVGVLGIICFFVFLFLSLYNHSCVLGIFLLCSVLVLSSSFAFFCSFLSCFLEIGVRVLSISLLFFLFFFFKKKRNRCGRAQHFSSLLSLFFL
jgi:hypothetical protein